MTFVINQAKHFYSALQAVSYVSDPELREMLYREVCHTQAIVREAMSQPEPQDREPAAAPRREVIADQTARINRR